MLRLKEIFKEKNTNATAVARSLGVASNTISRIARNETSPSLGMLENIARNLGVDIRELFEPSDAGALFNGFIEYNGAIYRIRTEKDIKELLGVVDRSTNS